MTCQSLVLDHIFSENKASPALFAYVKGIQPFGRHLAIMIPLASITDMSGFKNYGVLLEE
jgi:hypothetical protein